MYTFRGFVALVILFILMTLPCNTNEKAKGEEAKESYLLNTTAIRQVNSLVFVFEFGGCKYVFCNGIRLQWYESKYVNCIVSLDNKKVVYRFRDNITIVGYYDGRLYYIPYGRWPFEEVFSRKLNVLDFRSMENIEIICNYELERRRASIYSNGTICIPLEKNDDGYQYVMVSGERVIRYQKKAAILQSEDMQYYMFLPDTFSCESFKTEFVQVKDKTDHEYMLDLNVVNGRTAICVFELSGKRVAYCERGSDILFVEDANHKPELVFSIECMESRTALAVHDPYIYISIMRYEDLHESGKGYSRYDNDTVEGTYIIDTRDLSVSKISDFIFKGLYNLDDTCLYGCDSDGDIYRIDFSGSYEKIFSQLGKN